MSWESTRGPAVVWTSRTIVARRALLGTAGGVLLGAAVALGACGLPTAGPGRGAPRRLVIATGAAGGVYYPYGSGLANILTQQLRDVQATAEITSASVDNLRLLREGKADLAFTQADTLADALGGQRPLAEGGRVPAQSVAALYTDYTHVVTLASSGIRALADLRGRTVALGSEGSGTEIVARRLLAVVGLQPGADLQTLALGVGPAAEALRAGQIDAFFWLGGLPTTAVLDLATAPGVQVYLLPTAQALPALQAAHGADLYVPTSIPRTAYPGLAADVPTFGVANLLIAHEGLPEALVHRVTQVLFERQAELAAIHLEARHLTPAAAMQGSPAPFHPGAIRRYRELGVWAG